VDRQIENAPGQRVIRIRDGKVLGALPSFFAQCGCTMTWHPLAGTPHATEWNGGGILVCQPQADGCGFPWAFRLWLSDAETVKSTVWWDDRDSPMHKTQAFPVGFGHYRVQGDRRSGITDVLAKRKVADLPVTRNEFANGGTRAGDLLIGQSCAPGAAQLRGRLREDAKALEIFEVADVSDPLHPRLLSNRNVLGNAAPPVDHVIATYLAPWDMPLHFTGTYHGSPSHFGTDMGGIVARGERLYIQSSSFVYCIGPAVKGTPEDDPEVVAAIREAKRADDVEKYLASDSAQYRFEAVEAVARLWGASGLKARPAEHLRRLAAEDPYEEIRAEALRLLGLQAGQAGAAILRQSILDGVEVAHNRFLMSNPSNDAVMTLRVLGSDADAALAAMLAEEDAAVRLKAAAAVEVRGPGGPALRDALLARLSEDAEDRHVRGAAASALLRWPADATLAAAFAERLHSARAPYTQEPVFLYLLAQQKDDAQRTAFLADAVAKTGSREVRSQAVDSLVGAKAFDALGKTVGALEGMAMADAMQALAMAARDRGSREAAALAVDLLKAKLRSDDDPRVTSSLLGIAWRYLAADAAPLVPTLETLDLGGDEELVEERDRAIREIEGQMKN
jgi:hypothetical protein